jgi:hypothetical protein
MEFTSSSIDTINNMCPAAQLAQLGSAIGAASTSPLMIRVDGNGFAITNGKKTPYAVIGRACTIKGWKLVAFDTNGALVSDSLTCDVLASSAWNVAPTSITGSGTKPALAAASSASSTSLSGWTTSLAKEALLTVTISGSPATAFGLILILDVD